MVEAVATLVAGGALGYAGQRTRMCFVGGIRDRILVRDNELLGGLVAFVVTAWLLYSLAGAAGILSARQVRGGAAVPEDVSLQRSWDTLLALPSGGLGLLLVGAFAAFAVGVVSIAAEGCPFRQHVRAGQGESSAVRYLAGFYAGLLLYGWLGPQIVSVAGGS